MIYRNGREYTNEEAILDDIRFQLCKLNDKLFWIAVALIILCLRP